MFRLMAEEIHACERPRAAAEGCAQEKTSFRDSPEPLLRPPFIRPHKTEGGEIDKNQINQYKRNTDRSLIGKEEKWEEE